MALKSAGNTTVTFNSKALTDNLNTQSIAAVVNAIDTTVFSSTGTQSIAGMPTWTVSIGPASYLPVTLFVTVIDFDL